ncbi:hypothetical protein AS156_06475 [Bradyrhizobium macuxiense]|uniref:SAM-dependent methyltransferase n=1 Tax=Bradyrhizobium macuxiense TaxID=1755647 RepID=A0A109JT05_9BRAD|nr:DUF938 domain-containing protein [Bradyrhizobium macuxiense]KWV54627.1 hypothetical protein AS156_06475 [Bradyrhizobium macuxiense]
MSFAIEERSTRLSDDKPNIDPYPLSPYVAWAGNRNKDAILKSFEELFPTKGDALELATGAGLHINYLAPHFPNVRFQPSDYNQDVFETIKSKRLEGDNNNISDPILIDLTVSSTWPNADEQLYDVIFVINIFHVASLSIAAGIAALGAKLLKPSGFIAIYGPFKLDGKYTSPSNEAFDREIRAAGVPEWGLKDVRDIERETRRHGLALKRQLDLPASNFILLFGRS